MKTSLPYNQSFEKTNMQLCYKIIPWKYKELKENDTLKILGILLKLHISPKMDPYIDECMHHVYGFGQPRLTLLINCTKVTYDNYNTTQINKILINNFLTITLQLLY
jgi:hypothetical protein